MTGHPTLLWDVRLIAGDGSPPRDRMGVTLADGRIERIDGVAGEAPPAGAVNAAGRTLLPGLIDAHVHLSSDTDRSPGFGPPPFLHGEDPRPRELGYFILARAAAALLSAGITTVRDVGSYDDEGVAVRRAVELGLLDGPRVLSCGRIISATSPGGKIFGTMYREADGPDAMRKAVREQIRTGASFIKVMATGARSVEREDPEPAQMTSEEMGAIVDEARRMGFRVAAHAEGLAGARLAIEQGVDTIEHGLSLHRAPELLAAMAQRGQVLVPTLTTFHDLSERFVACFAPVLVEQAKRQQDEAYRTVAAARAARVTLAMGHDSGPPGANLIEAVRMVDAGLSAMEGITAATANAALALGLRDVGTIRPGAAADLVLVDGDPSADIRLLTEPERIWLVLVAGHPVAGRALAPEPLSHHA